VPLISLSAGPITCGFCHGRLKQRFYMTHLVDRRALLCCAGACCRTTHYRLKRRILPVLAGWSPNRQLAPNRLVGDQRARIVQQHTSSMPTSGRLWGQPSDPHWGQTWGAISLRLLLPLRIPRFATLPLGWVRTKCEFDCSLRVGRVLKYISTRGA
jgi:hypothetical protein